MNLYHDVASDITQEKDTIPVERVLAIEKKKGVDLSQRVCA